MENGQQLPLYAEFSHAPPLGCRAGIVEKEIYREPTYEPRADYLNGEVRKCV